MQIVLLIFLCLSPCEVYAKQILSALIACDTYSDLRTTTRKDTLHLRSALRSLCTHTDLRLKIHFLNGEALTAKNVDTWVRGIENAPSDIVFFYYSGHGRQANSTSTPWPYLLFPKNVETFPVEPLCERLEKLSSRLVIIILDCCNSIVRSKLPNPISFAFKGLPVKKSFPGLKTLFLKSQGRIIAAGAKPGEDSYSLDNGSFFTNSLIKALRTETTSAKVSWNSIFTQTALECSSMQHPIYQLTVFPIPDKEKKNRRLHRARARDSHAGKVKRHRMDVETMMRIAK